jgi:hypothetical protein
VRNKYFLITRCSLLVAHCFFLAGCAGWERASYVSGQRGGPAARSGSGGQVYLRAVRSSDGPKVDWVKCLSVPDAGAAWPQLGLAIGQEKSADMPAGGREFCAPLGEPMYVEAIAFQKSGEPQPTAPARSVPLGENESSMALSCDGTERHVVSIGLLVSAQIEGKVTRVSLQPAFRPEGGAAPQPFDVQAGRIDIDPGQAAIVSSGKEYGLGGMMLSPKPNDPSGRLWLIVERLP